MKRVLLCLLALLLLAGCEREERHFQAERQNTGPNESAVRNSLNQPGMALSGYVKPPADNISMYDDNAFAVNEGKRLYRWYNCSGRPKSSATSCAMRFSKPLPSSREYGRLSGSAHTRSACGCAPCACATAAAQARTIAGRRLTSTLH